MYLLICFLFIKSWRKYFDLYFLCLRLAALLNRNRCGAIISDAFAEISDDKKPIFFNLFHAKNGTHLVCMHTMPAHFENGENVTDRLPVNTKTAHFAGRF